ncbi:hypothetical protein O3P69_007757 [Scylla paramamosain]|uniref:Uncharacterized protein n=1 Tax=Scylla paramamosain TaxID=85552 RepID=A0AAW0UXS0_SCYPA
MDTGDMSNYQSNGEFDLVEFTAAKNITYYSCCPEPYPDITFHHQAQAATNVLRVQSHPALRAYQWHSPFGVLRAERVRGEGDSGASRRCSP